MNDEKCKEIFFNRAEVESAERISCEKCFERVVFSLKDNYHDFSVGLTTVLECLAFAISQGELPKLPRSWCADVEHALNITFGEEISYYDYETFKERQTKK